MISETKIFDLIKEQLEEENIFLVSLKVASGNKINVQIDSLKGITVESCIRFSRLIEHSLDREIEDFELEVSSPGIGQPFKVHQQFLKNEGKKVEVLIKSGLKIEGILTKVRNEDFTVKVDKLVKVEGKKKKELQISEYTYKFDDVKSVKEVISF